MVLSTHLVEMRKLLSQEKRGVSLEQVRYQCGTKTRRRTHEDVDVIFIRFHGQYRQVVFLATCSDEPLGFHLYLTGQHAAAVLWYPYEVISY